MMATRHMSTATVIAIAAIGIFLTITTAGLLSASQTVPTTGTVTGTNVTSINVGVFNDVGFSQNCTNINWGTLAPGNSTSKNVYVKNTGSIPIKLSMSTANWSPSNANTYLVLSWNQQNVVLNPGGSVVARLTLTASANAGSISTFSFNIVITGTQ